MRAMRGCVLVGLLVAVSAYGAVYKEGKEVMESGCRVDVLKMQWGVGDAGMDRLIGTVRLYITPADVNYEDITLVFDVYSRKAVTNDAPARDAKGQTRAPKTEKVDTITVTFDYDKYGYKSTRQYIEGEFCHDFARNPEANRLHLVNVKYKGAAVTYRTSFNMNSSLLKSLFRLPEPKVAATKQ